jgi:hypothetical protein
VYVAGIASHIVSCIGTDTEPGPYDKGLIFLKDRDILLTGDKWTIAVNIALDNYLSLTKGMRFALAQIRKDIETYRNPNKKDFDIHWEEIKHLEQMVQLLEVDLESIFKLLIEDVPKNSRNRNKRGLIHLIGTGLKYLFGTADAKDVKRLNIVCDKLHAFEQKVVHATEQQLSYLRTLDEATKENAKNTVD